MKPIDYRNETFEMLLARGLVSERLAVYEAFRKHGPGTTREVALRSGIDILNLRPRATELYQLGFLKVLQPGDSDSSHGAIGVTEGIYRAYSRDEALAKFFVNQRAASGAHQTEMQLGT